MKKITPFVYVIFIVLIPFLLSYVFKNKTIGIYLGIYTIIRFAIFIYSNVYHFKN